MSQSPVQWKNEQREILRASFPTAFVKYTELVNKVNEPDDWRKYLDFIARQVGLEEPTNRSGPHDNLATVNINIGGFARTAMPMVTQVMPTPLEVQEVDTQEPEPAAPSFAGVDAGLLALDVLAPEPQLAADFESTLDDLLS